MLGERVSSCPVVSWACVSHTEEFPGRYQKQATNDPMVLWVLTYVLCPRDYVQFSVLQKQVLGIFPANSDALCQPSEKKSVLSKFISFGVSHFSPHPSKFNPAIKVQKTPQGCIFKPLRRIKMLCVWLCLHWIWGKRTVIVKAAAPSGRWYTNILEFSLNLQGHRQQQTSNNPHPKK